MARGWRRTITSLPRVAPNPWAPRVARRRCVAGHGGDRRDRHGARRRRRRRPCAPPRSAPCTRTGRARSRRRCSGALGDPDPSVRRRACTLAGGGSATGSRARPSTVGALVAAAGVGPRSFGGRMRRPGRSGKPARPVVAGGGRRARAGGAATHATRCVAKRRWPPSAPSVTPAHWHRPRRARGQAGRPAPGRHRPGRLRRPARRRALAPVPRATGTGRCARRRRTSLGRRADGAGQRPAQASAATKSWRSVSNDSRHCPAPRATHSSGVSTRCTGTAVSLARRRARPRSRHRPPRDGCPGR